MSRPATISTRPRIEVLTATKKNPGQSTLPGSLQVVASTCGSYDPGGVGVSGDGDAVRIWAAALYVHHALQADVTAVTQRRNRVVTARVPVGTMGYSKAGNRSSHATLAAALTLQGCGPSSAARSPSHVTNVSSETA